MQYLQIAFLLILPYRYITYTFEAFSIVFISKDNGPILSFFSSPQEDYIISLKGAEKVVLIV